MLLLSFAACLDTAGYKTLDGPPQSRDSDTSSADAPRVALRAPLDGAAVDDPVRFEVDASGVASVRLSADGYPLGEPFEPSLPFDYDFHDPGERALLVEGLDTTGRVVATDTATVYVNPPTLGITSPADGAETSNPVTFTLSGASISTVRLEADGYPLGDDRALADATTWSYTFDEVNRPREITASGIDSYGEIVVTDRVTVTPVEPEVRLLSPTDGARVENPVQFTVEAWGVSTVRLDADGWELGSWDPATTDSLSYTFSDTDTARTVTLTGYDAAGAELATDTITIHFDTDTTIDVPYFYQYDNRYEPSATCGITSAAMLVNTWYPEQVTPDDLYVRYGKAQGQSPSGLAQLYAWEGLYSTYSYAGTRDQIRAHLDAGRPVVVHGWWTSAGHVVVLVGYDDTSFIANDPAGDYDVCYGCGWGDGVHYAYGGAWDDALGGDGEIWYSTGDVSGF